MPEFLKGKTGGPSDDPDDPLPSSTLCSRPSIPIRAKSLHVPISEQGPTLFEYPSQSRSSNIADAGHESRFAGEYVVYCDDKVCCDNSELDV